VINYSDQEAQGKILVSNANPINGNDTIAIIDLLSKTTYYRSAIQMRTDGLHVIISPWWAQIFQY